MIKEITVELNGVATLDIYENTDVEQLLLDYSNDDEFTLSQISIVIDEVILEVKAHDKWLELYDELPNDDRENFSVSEWQPHDEDFYNIYFESDPIGAVRAVLFGDVRWNDDYVRFNGYGNLETAIQIPYENEADSIITSWVSKLI